MLTFEDIAERGLCCDEHGQLYEEGKHVGELPPGCHVRPGTHRASPVLEDGVYRCYAYRVRVVLYQGNEYEVREQPTLKPVKMFTGHGPFGGW